MTADEVHAWLEDNEPPWVFRTTGGRSYRITDRANAWIPAAYPEMLCVAVVSRGITLLKISTIESFHVEHDAITSR
jgi:hypothetical protein